MLTAEIVSIGNELLNGSTINSNATFISAKLKGAGIRVNRHTAIPDKKEIIIETLSESLSCASLVIATGGLGPTVDDLTREAIAELMETPLEYNEKLASELEKRFGAIDSLENQATVPKSADLLVNAIGTAAGLVFIKGSAVLVILPGVPLEMELMLEKQVLPYLEKVFPPQLLKTSEKLYFYHLFESSVDPLLRELEKQFPELEIGIYPRYGLLTVHLEGSSRDVLLAKEAIIQQFGKHQYESSDGKIETAIAELFIRNSWTLSLAESCTGGAISARLTQIPGASKYFIGSMVVYSNQLKEKWLHVTTIEENGAVSKQTSVALAEAIQKETGSSFSIGITGIAGPTGGSESKPVGTVYVAFKKDGQPPKYHLLSAKGDRTLILEQSVNFALGELYHFVYNSPR